MASFQTWFRTAPTDWDEGLITRLTQFVEEIRKRALWPELVPKLHEILHQMTENVGQDQRTRALAKDLIDGVARIH